jgi:hypothetical protein
MCIQWLLYIYLAAGFTFQYSWHWDLNTLQLWDKIRTIIYLSIIVKESISKTGVFYIKTKLPSSTNLYFSLKMLGNYSGKYNNFSETLQYYDRIFLLVILGRPDSVYKIWIYTSSMKLLYTACIGTKIHRLGLIHL